jgi:hypothetical protein
VSAIDGSNGLLLHSAQGTSLENMYGYSVAGVGDIDQDGIGDYVVGCPHEDKGNQNNGRVFAYRGAITDDCVLELVGTPQVGQMVSLRHLGTPLAPSLIAMDATAGPTSIAPFGSVQLGLTPYLSIVSDSAALFGTPMGPSITTDGVADFGPFLVPVLPAGMTIYFQAFSFWPYAPNSIFQRTNGMGVTIIP